jgi:hypothetical protein
MALVEPFARSLTTTPGRRGVLDPDAGRATSSSDGETGRDAARDSGGDARRGLGRGGHEQAAFGGLCNRSHKVRPKLLPMGGTSCNSGAWSDHCPRYCSTIPAVHSGGPPALSQQTTAGNVAQPQE